MKKYIYQYRFYFLGALLCTLLSSLFAVVLQFFKGDVLDSAAAGQWEETVCYGILLVVFILLEIAFYFFFRWFLAKFVVGCTRSLKEDIFSSILRKTYVRYRDIPQGAYLAKLTSEADAIKSRFFDMILSFWEILWKILFVSVALFLLDWRIAVVTLVLLTMPLYVPKLIENRLQTAQSAYLQANSETIAKLNDWLYGFEIIKNYSIENQIMARFSESNRHTMDRMLSDNMLSNLAQLLTTLISYLSYFIVLGCSAWLVLRGDFSAGDFFVAVGMIDQLSWPLISLSQIIHHLVAIQPTCRTMEEFLADSQGPEEKGLTGFQDGFCFQDVTFGYDDGVPILQDMNFTIQKGKRYLFRGPSGCGKTTAMNLLLRYYDTWSGRILVDGRDLADYGNSYGCMTVLRQDAVLFQDTLRNNLTMYQQIEDSVLIGLLMDLGLDKFANSQALDGMITENGSNLSGGERKRICLARALLRNTDLLILDEPLANLDRKTAGKIEELILSIQDRTLIVVSHQFSAEKQSCFDGVLDFAK